MIACPFCREADFDLIGLKGHLLRWCEAFESTDSLHIEALRRGADLARFSEEASERIEAFRRERSREMP